MEGLDGLTLLFGYQVLAYYRMGIKGSSTVGAVIGNVLKASGVEMTVAEITAEAKERGLTSSSGDVAGVVRTTLRREIAKGHVSKVGRSGYVWSEVLGFYRSKAG